MNDKFKIIYEKSPVGIFFYDNKGIITGFNDKFVEILGSSHDKLYGLDTFALPNKKIVNEIKKSLTEGQGFYYDWYTTYTSGKTIFVKCYFIGIKNERNIINEGFGLIENLTELKNKEEELSKLVNIFHNSQNPIIIVDLNDNKVIKQNKFSVRIFGKIFNKNITDIIKKCARNNFDDFLQGKKKKFRSTFITKKGEKLFIVSKNFIDEEKKLLALYFLDITKIHSLSAKIRQYLYFRQSLIENLPYAIIFKDIKNRWLITNSYNLNLWGIQNIYKNKIHEEEIVKHIKPELQNVFLKFTKLTDELSEITITDNNQTRILEIKKIEIKNRIGKTIAYLIIGHDVTNIKQLINKLSDSIIQSEKNFENKSLFVASVTHEIKNQLNSIVGITEILKASIASDAVIPYINKIQSSVIDITSILNDFLEYSKIEAGKLNIFKHKINLWELLNNVIEKEKQHAISKNLELITDVDYNVPEMIFTDPLRLSQILQNLLNNAIKYTSSGYVLLKVEFSQIVNNIGKVRFSVIDTGIGINPEKIKFLFNPYSQINVPISSHSSSVGLGLAIVKNLVELLNGKIYVESEVNKGSKFTVEIETTYWQHTAKSHLKNFHIAIISQNEIYREIILKYLNHLNEFNVIFNDVQKLLTNAKSFDIIIYDEKINLPPLKNSIMATYLPQPSSLIIPKPTFFYHLRDFLDSYENIYSKTSEKEEKTDNLSRYKILIVEDNSLNLALIKLFLQKISPYFDLSDAYNGAEAIQKIKEEKFDLIIMDIQLPEINGIEATKYIREFEKESKNYTPIIAVTAALSPDENYKCFDAGINEFLTKPLDLLSLKKTIQKYLEI